MQPTTQFDSAFYPPWDGKISTSQKAVMLCGWGVKAGICNLQVKLCDPCLRALEVVRTMRYTNRRILYFTLRRWTYIK